MAGSLIVGTVSIKVRPDMTGFKKSVEQYMKRMGTARVRVAPTGLKDFRKDIEKSLGKGVNAKVSIDAADAVKQVQKQVAAKPLTLKSALDTAEVDKKLGKIRNQHIDVDVRANGRKVRRVSGMLKGVLGGLRRAASSDLARGIRWSFTPTFDGKATRRLRSYLNRVRNQVGSEPSLKTGATSEVGEKLRLVRAIEKTKRVARTAYRPMQRLKQAAGFSEGWKSFEKTSDEVEVLERNVDSLDSSMRKQQKTQKRTKRKTGFGGVRRKGLRSVDELGTQKFAGLSRVGWIIGAVAALIAPAVQAVAGLSASLPALGFAAAAALGATVLGWEGIKKASEAAAPALEQAKTELSGVFQERLTPQFATLGETLTAITPRLNRVAHGMADFSQGMVDAVSSKAGMRSINEALGQTSRLFSHLKPFSQDFTEGMLEAAAAGSRSFPKLADGLNRFGKTFKQNIAELSENGLFQQAVESTYTVLGSMGTNIGRLVRTGIESFTPQVAAMWDGLFTSLAGAVDKLMPVLSSFTSAVGEVLTGALDILGDWGEALGPGLSKLFDNVIPPVVDSLRTIGSMLGEILSPLADFVGWLSGPLGDALSFSADAYRGFAAAMFEVSEKSATLEQARKNVEEFNKTAKEFESGYQGDKGTSFGETMGHTVREASKLAAVIPGLQPLGAALQGIFMTKDAKRFQADLDLLKQANVTVEDFVSNTRFQELRKEFKFSLTAEVLIEDGLKTVDWAADLEANIDRKIHVLESLGKVANIDVSTEVKLVESAKDLDELQRYSNWLSARFMEGTIGKPLEIPVEATPEILLNEIEIDTSSVDGALEQSMSDLGSGMGAAAQSALGDKAEEIGGIAEAQAQATAQKLGDAFGNMEIPTEGLTASLGEALNTLRDSIAEQTTDIATGLEENFRAIPERLSAAFEGIGNSVSAVTASLPEGVTAAFSALAEQVQTELLNVQTVIQESTAGIGEALSVSLGPVAENLKGSLSGVSAVVTEQFSGLGAQVTAALSGVSAGVSQEMSAVTSAVVDAGTQAEAGFTSSMQTLQTNAVAAAQATASGVRGALEMDLTSSGLAVANTFAAGITAGTGAAVAAAQNLASSVRRYFPNSPAKEGPFSGAGWVDRSGLAVSRDFAKGVEAGVGKARNAAHALAEAVRNPLSGGVLYHGDMEDFQRNKILQPVLESNAKKIADWRKREADAAERSQKRLDKIAESGKDQAKKESEIAAEREEAAKKNAESYQELLDSLEAPDYSKMDRSFQSYWIEGSKERSTEWAKSLNIAGGLRDATNQALSQLRSVFGDNPVFAQVEANVNAEHFQAAINQVIEESEIAEIPINFAVANLNQLKSDLGMGDGVVSRAIDQFVRYNPNNSDANRFGESSKTEVHYHVADMNEAIRLEELRRRKEALKSR